IDHLLMEEIGDHDPGGRTERGPGQRLDQVARGGVHVIGDAAIAVDHHLRDQRAGEHQHIDQQEKAAEQQHRTGLVRCDMGVETVGSHDIGLSGAKALAQNFTLGAASSSVRLAPRSKNSLRVKPKVPANSAAGICWIRSEERRVGKECRSRWWAYHVREEERVSETTYVML